MARSSVWLPLPTMMEAGKFVLATAGLVKVALCVPELCSASDTPWSTLPSKMMEST